MVTARTNDSCVEGFSPASRLRFLFSDVSDTARKLHGKHGCTLASATALAETLAGVALIGIDVLEQDETITMHIETDGAIGGCLAEMSGRGLLRGYAHNGNVVRERPPVPESGERGKEKSDDAAADVWGGAVKVRVTRTGKSGKLRSQMVFSTVPSGMTNVLHELYNTSLQIPTQVCVAVTTYNNRIETARAFAVQRMPDGNSREFGRLGECFKDGTVKDLLEFDCTVTNIREVLGVHDLTTGPTRSLQFGCTCSQKKFENAASTLSAGELADLARRHTPLTCRCHLCGETYVVLEDLLSEFATRAGD